MTQEEKQLLLVDLCARLPYGVKLQWAREILTLNENWLRLLYNHPEDAKSYLRPISSMTDEEAMEYLGMLNDIDKSGLMNQNFITKVVDWLDKKMFDHRGLLPKGLALEATKEMY